MSLTGEEWSHIRNCLERVEMMGRVPTGIDGLDELIEGGFPKESLIVLGGSPGTGKSVFGTQFLCKGALDCGEKGVHVSFAEGKKALIANMSQHLGLDLNNLIRRGKLEVLDYSTVREAGITTVFEHIIDTIKRLEARRLVIDSFTAMAQSFEKPVDVRIALHTILGKLVRGLGCTILLIVEIPLGKGGIGLGMEEFVADGVILFKAGELDGQLFRDMEIVKMRGTPLSERKVVFTLKGGFKAFPPFRAKPVEKSERFKPIPDPPGKFSTGVQELDYLLGGGFPKGSTVLLEVDEQVSTFQYHLVTSPTPLNFLAKERAVMAIPSSGVDHNVIKRVVREAGFTEDEFNRFIRVCTFEFLSAPREPCIVKFEGKSIEEDYQRCNKTEEELMNETGQPVLCITGTDSLIAYYGKEAMTRMWNLNAARIRETGNLGILLLKPGYNDLSKILGAIADMHLKMTREHGALIFYGIKPRTSLHVVEVDDSKGYVLPKLTPII